MNDQPRQPQQFDEVTQAFPPELRGVVTEVEAQVIQFPGFVGGVGVNLVCSCGPLKLVLMLHPATLDIVIETLAKAKTFARTGIQAASPQDVAAVVNGSR